MSNPIVLVVGHGSRRAEAVAQFHAFIDALARQIGQSVQHCFLELADPDLATGLSNAACEAGDGGEVVVLPLFLGGAAHQKNDLPAALRWARDRYPHVTFRYGTPLGPHANLVELLDLRVRECLEAHPGALPAQETAVLVAARGSSDPDANSEIARTAHLLFEKRPYLAVEYAFQAVAHPTVDEGIRRCHRLGAHQVIVAPFLLFTGRVDEDIRHTSLQAGRNLGLPVLHSRYFETHPLLLNVAIQRIKEALEGRAVMNCDVCKYRLPMSGYETQVGLAQATHHLRGGSAHAHHEHHENADEHR